eukprot:1143737-Pelagomonas_calceolata.AAC.4
MLYCEGEEECHDKERWGKDNVTSCTCSLFVANLMLANALGIESPAQASNQIKAEHSSFNCHAQPSPQHQKTRAAPGHEPNHSTNGDSP